MLRGNRWNGLCSSSTHRLRPDSASNQPPKSGLSKLIYKDLQTRSGLLTLPKYPQDPLQAKRTIKLFFSFFGADQLIVKCFFFNEHLCEDIALSGTIFDLGFSKCPTFVGFFFLLNKIKC